MLIQTSNKRLRWVTVQMTTDGNSWVPLTTIKERLNGYRTPADGKWTNKKLERILESLNIVPVKFRGSATLYITSEEYQMIEMGYIAFAIGESDNEVFNIRL